MTTLHTGPAPRRIGVLVVPSHEALVSTADRGSYINASPTLVTTPRLFDRRLLILLPIQVRRQVPLLTKTMLAVLSRCYVSFARRAHLFAI